MPDIVVNKETMVPKYFVSHHKIYYVYCKDKEEIDKFFRENNISGQTVIFNTKFMVWCAGVYSPNYKKIIESKLERS